MIATFVLKLMCGITLMWLLMPRREVTDGFFRIQMRLVLGLAVLGALLLSNTSLFPPNAGLTENTIETASGWLRSGCIVAAVLSYFGSVFWALGRRTPGNLTIMLLVACTATMLTSYGRFVPNDVSVWLQLLSDFSSAAVAGSVLTGMLLGHWYLTTPTMSIQPLTWFNGAIVVSAVLRGIASGWMFFQAGLPSSDLSQQLWLGMRWCGGIVAPIAAAVLVWRILKLRNTQSATGVYFACLILVFMGEMTAALLERQTGLPY